MAPTQVMEPEILRRIKGEFDEMPGLRLTPAQAARLWGLDHATCEHTLARLVEQRILSRTRDGAFVRQGSDRAVWA